MTISSYINWSVDKNLQLKRVSMDHCCSNGWQGKMKISPKTCRNGWDGKLESSLKTWQQWWEGKPKNSPKTCSNRWEGEPKISPKTWQQWVRREAEKFSKNMQQWREGKKRGEKGCTRYTPTSAQLQLHICNATQFWYHCSNMSTR